MGPFLLDVFRMLLGFNFTSIIPPIVIGDLIFPVSELFWVENFESLKLTLPEFFTCGVVFVLIREPFFALASIVFLLLGVFDLLWLHTLVTY